MKINDPIDNPTEATMSDIATPRYGFEPKAAFAATRAGADRRARETAAAAARNTPKARSARRLFRRLAAHIAAPPSSPVWSSCSVGR